MEKNELPVAVLGAGPVGLAAAARLVERGLEFAVLEAGDDVAASVAEWGHVRLFSPWRMNVDPVARRLLLRAGWSAPDEQSHPTGAELIDRYLRPLAAVPEVAARLHMRHRVRAVGRLGAGRADEAGREGRPFAITVETAGHLRRLPASAVIDATGTWRSPNPLGAGGVEAIGEGQARSWIVYGIPDILGAARDRYAARRVAVVGSGHSAQTAVRDLGRLRSEEPGTAVTWVARRSDPARMLGGEPDDRLPERGRLGARARHLVATGEVRLVTGFRVDAVVRDPAGVVLQSSEGRPLGPFDEVIGATGFRPELDILREVRLELDPSLECSRALGPLIDPRINSCASVPPHGEAELRHPEPGVYLVGAKSYGRAPTFLLATGYGQVRSVVAHLAGDREGAPRAGPALPSIVPPAVAAASERCCG